MNIENIILLIIIGIAVIVTVRRIYLILFSKKPPRCSGCNHSCSTSDNTRSECSSASTDTNDKN